jgi:hypothetical protein
LKRQLRKKILVLPKYKVEQSKKVTFYEPNQMTAVIVSPDKGKKMTFPRWHRFKKKEEKPTLFSQ